MREVKAPNQPEVELRLFLAGSIDMGNAFDWQKQLVSQLSDISNLVILNLRRDDWDSSWEQSIQNKQFFEQVSWELDMMEAADRIALYFAANTKSPISLLELGLFAKSGKLIVCCHEGFYRKGNVDIVCERNHIPHTMHFDNFVKMVRQP